MDMYDIPCPKLFSILCVCVCVCVCLGGGGGHHLKKKCTQDVLADKPKKNKSVNSLQLTMCNYWLLNYSLTFTDC